MKQPLDTSVNTADQEVILDYEADVTGWELNLDADIQKELAKSLGISEEFLSGEVKPDGSAEYFDKIKRDGQSFEYYRMGIMTKLANKITWNYCAITSTRKGVIVHVWKPETGIHHFRSRRTAKVWNKRRLQNATA